MVLSILRSLLLSLLVSSVLPAQTDPPDPLPAPAPDSSNAVRHPRMQFLDLEGNTRFNYMDREGGPVTDRGLQYRIHGLFRANLTSDGTTWFLLRAETGKGFDNSWNNSGAGLGKGQWIFNVKSVALGHQFGGRFAIRIGGLDFDPGAGTDSIYASGDGYITGYRAVYTGRPDGSHSKISLTAAYLGDFEKPNFFSRARMDRLNYVQLLVEQSWAENLHASVEVDSIHDVVFSRAALRHRRVWVLDDPTIEAVMRATDGGAFAWSASVSHRWGASSPWRTNLVYADLPARLYEVAGHRILLNRGEIDIGKRLAVGTEYRLTRDCEIGIFGGRLLDGTQSKRWIAQVGVSYQFAGLMNHLTR
jgi:hypothetical protein